MATVEAHTFGLEFVPLLVGVDMMTKLDSSFPHDVYFCLKDTPKDIANQLLATSPW